MKTTSISTVNETLTETNFRFEVINTASVLFTNTGTANAEINYYLLKPGMSIQINSENGYIDQIFRIVFTGSEGCRLDIVKEIKTPIL